MKIGLITDIHANIEALTAVLAELDREGVDQIVCLGDVVGYGADPEACCTLVRQRAALTLVGNHDAGAVGRLNLSRYHDEVREVLESHRRLISPENYAWLQSLPFEEVDEVASAAYCHASPEDPEVFHYVLDADSASIAAYARRQDLGHLRAVFFGHSHLPRCFAVDADYEVVCSGKQGVITLRPDLRYYISVPSSGQPRDYDVRAGAGIYDTEASTFTFVRVEYDYEAAARKIEVAGYPSEYAIRLYHGV